MNQHPVFVYGTFRKNESNHSFMEGAKLIAGQAWTNGRLFDTGLGYPALRESEDNQIYGEIYLVTHEQLERLDELEGYQPNGRNNLYDRKKQVVFHDTGSAEAFVYVIAKKKERMLRKHLPSGDCKLEKYHVTMQNLLYFAYGSCMDDQRFQEDGVGHLFQNIAGAGIVHNYTLRFARKSIHDGMGRADIVEEGGRVEGKVYEIPFTALKDYLYAREGAPHVCRPTFVTVVLNGKNVEALTFVVKNKKEETAPPYWYVEEILRGAAGFLSERFIMKVQEHIEALKNSLKVNGGMNNVDL